MNDIAKQAAIDKLMKEISLEKIRTSEAAAFLGLNPIYISMFLNTKHWKKLPAYAWDRVIKWCNSGSLLKHYKIPLDAVIYKPKNKIKNNPVTVIEESVVNIDTRPEEINQESIKTDSPSEKIEINVLEVLNDFANSLSPKIKITITINDN